MQWITSQSNHYRTMKLTEDQVKEVTENLKLGYTAYINPDTGDIKYLIDEGKYPDAREMFGEEMDEIDAWDYVAELREMPSFEAFRVMEDFAYKVDDDFHDDLMEALNKGKPFANFRELVESSEYREEWFEYRNQRYLEYTERLLKEEDIEFESNLEEDYE